MGEGGGGEEEDRNKKKRGTSPRPTTRAVGKSAKDPRALTMRR